MNSGNTLPALLSGAVKRLLFICKKVSRITFFIYG